MRRERTGGHSHIEANTWRKYWTHFCRFLLPTRTTYIRQHCRVLWWYPARWKCSVVRNLHVFCLGPAWKIFLFRVTWHKMCGMLWYIPSFAHSLYSSRQAPTFSRFHHGGPQVSFAGTVPSWYRAQYGLLTKLWRRAKHCLVHFDVSILRGRRKELRSVMRLL